QVAFQQLTETILDRPGAAARFFPSLDRFAAAMADSSDDLARTFAPAAAAMQPFVDRRRSVRAALDEAPAALSAADGGLARGRRLLSATRALASATHATLPPAPAGMRSAAALLRGSHLPLRRATALLRATR